MVVPDDSWWYFVPSYLICILEFPVLGLKSIFLLVLLGSIISFATYKLVPTDTSPDAVTCPSKLALPATNQPEPVISPVE